MSPYSIGIIFIVFGVLFYFLVFIITRRSTLPVKPNQFKNQAYFEEFLPTQTHGVVVIRPGGKIKFVNQKIRDYLKISLLEKPDLEFLLRKIHPANEFLNLCSAEARGKFEIENEPFEVFSFKLFLEDETFIVVLFQKQDSKEGNTAEARLNQDTLKLFSGLISSLGTIDELDLLLKSLLLTLEKLISTDWVELTIWNPELSCLVPYMLNYLAENERVLESSEDCYIKGEGYSGYIALERKRLEKLEGFQSAAFEEIFDEKKEAYKSYLGLPLLVGNKFVGTIEIGSFNEDGISYADGEMLEFFSYQASIAILNQQQRQQESQRHIEFDGLNKLIQSITSFNSEKNIYEVLLEDIQQLVDVEVLGFLIYDETHQTLAGRWPFLGLPPQFVELYKSVISPNSAAEELVMKQKIISVANASDNYQWETLGFIHLAQAASLKDSILIPLSTGGRMLGYLQASNHRDGSRVFNDREIWLLSLAAAQSALIIENSLLGKQNYQRSKRFETIRNITRLTSSSADHSDVLKMAVKELALLLDVDAAVLFLFDSNSGILKVDENSNYGATNFISWRNPALSISDSQFPFTVMERLHPIFSGNVSSDINLIPFYKENLQDGKFESLLVAPLVVRDNGLGELWMVKKKADYFNQRDLHFVSMVCTQLAFFIEQDILMNQTDENLRKQIKQLNTLRQLSLEISASQDINYLLQLVYDETMRITAADFGNFLLFDPNIENPEKIRIITFLGDPRFEDLSKSELTVLSKGSADIIINPAEEGIWVPDKSIKSMLIVPIRYFRNNIGVILLYGKRADLFDDFSLEISKSIAAQAAVVAGTSHQYEIQKNRSSLLQRQLITMERLFQVSQKLRSNYPLKENLEIILEATKEITSFNSILFSVYDPVNKGLRTICEKGVSSEKLQEMQEQPISWVNLEKLFLDNFKIESAYFIPVEKAPEGSDKFSLPGQEDYLGTELLDGWQKGDLLFVPLFNANGSPLGVIHVSNPENGRRPDMSTIQSLELFGMQAALMMESHRYINALSTNLSEVEANQFRMQSSVRTIKQQIPVLLQKQMDHEVVIRRLQQKLNWAVIGQEVVHIIGQFQDVHSFLPVLADELLKRLDFQTVLVAEKQTTGPRLLYVSGEKTDFTRLEAGLGQKNPIRPLLLDNKIQICGDIQNSEEWLDSNLLKELQANSFITLLINGDGGQAWGFLFTGEDNLEGFDEDNVLYQLSGQLSLNLRSAMSLQNARLHLREIDMLLDFSRKLGGLDTRSIFRTLLENIFSVIRSADAGWIALWDEESKKLTPEFVQGYLNDSELEAIKFVMTGDIQDAALPVKVFHRGKAILVNEIQFARDYVLSQDDLILYRRALGNETPLSSLLVPLFRGAEKIGLLVLDSFSASDAFSAQDLELAEALLYQVSLALENAKLFADIERRTASLRGLTQVANIFTSSLNREELIQALLEQLKAIVPFDTGILWLREGQQLSVADARGFSDNESRLGIRVSIEDSLLFQDMIRTGTAISISDVREDKRFSAMIAPENLSWLGIPLLAKSEVIGLIALEKQEPHFYLPEYVQAATTFASQAAVSLENARIFEESVQRSEELNERTRRLTLLNELSGDLNVSLNADEIVRETSEKLLKNLAIDRVLLVFVEENERFLFSKEFPQSEAVFEQQVFNSPLLEHLRQSEGIFNSHDVRQEEGQGEVLKSYFLAREVKSLLIVPLRTSFKLYGWLFLCREELGRFSQSEIELTRTVGNQMAIALQNANLYLETHKMTDELEKRVNERTAELQKEHQNTQTLLNIITELSSSIDIDEIMEKTLTILNTSIGSEQSLVIMADGTSRSFSCGKNLIKVDLIRDMFAVVPEQEMAGWVIKNKELLLIEDVSQDDRWDFKKHVDVSFDYASLVGVPLFLGDQILGALLLAHTQKGFFKADMLDLVEASAKQISIAINNAELFDLTRDQSDRLYDMLRDQQIDSSRSISILEAVADGVLVTDAEDRITLFNISAERILGLTASQVVGKPLNMFAGIFGSAALKWKKRIQLWSDNPAKYKGGDSYAEQLELENGRVVLVHLAPVILGENFLGTVSIFRDITQEVLVDRLKSDFVANVSHELRTPMTSIKGYVEILLMGAAGKLEEQQEHFLHIIKDNTERLKLLVDDLLDISHIEAGKTELTFEAVDVKKIAEEVLESMRGYAEEQKKIIHFHLICEGEIPRITGDAEKIRQVIESLVKNGFIYTPENGDVTIHLKSDEDEVQVDVKDNGIGIAPENHERIFERFYRGEHPLVLASAGTGLGLAISKILVDMHHGRIWFESSGVEGEGSIFSFAIPVYPKED